MSVDIRCLCIIAVSIFPLVSPAQEWVARYNGPGNIEDVAFALAIDDADNVYVTGVSVDLATGPDYATVKYDSSGVEQWVVRYNGTSNGYDFARAIAIDGAGSIYVTGYSDGLSTCEDFATVKYDSSGLEHWTARYNGPGDSSDYAYAIAVDNTGSVIVTGYSAGSSIYGDYATVKYDSSGLQQWVARYDSPDARDDEARAIAVDAAGNVYVTGWSFAWDTWPDYATVKYDSSGIEQWVARYNGPANGGDWAEAITVDPAGNVYVTGTSAGQGADYATIKYDSSGVEQWVARYSGSGNGHDDRAYAIALDDVGNIYVTGKSDGLGTGPDYATIKYNPLGVEQWVARYNGPDSLGDYGYAIAISNSGNVCVTGWSYSAASDADYATVVYDSTGIELWAERYNGPGNGNDEASTHWDYATIKYSSTGVEENILTVVDQDEITTTIIRGPLLLPTGKKCRVYDITGRVVESDKIRPGIYFIELDGVVIQKVVKIR